jgi:hypothetical protein
VKEAVTEVSQCKNWILQLKTLIALEAFAPEGHTVELRHVLKQGGVAGEHRDWCCEPPFAVQSGGKRNSDRLNPGPIV